MCFQHLVVRIFCSPESRLEKCRAYRASRVWGSWQVSRPQRVGGLVFWGYRTWGPELGAFKALGFYASLDGSVLLQIVMI